VRIAEMVSASAIDGLVGHIDGWDNIATVGKMCLYQTDHANHWGIYMVKSHLKLVLPRT
jgi:hypothetical protein